MSNNDDVFRCVNVMLFRHARKNNTMDQGFILKRKCIEIVHHKKLFDNDHFFESTLGYPSARGNVSMQHAHWFSKFKSVGMSLSCVRFLSFSCTQWNNVFWRVSLLILTVFDTTIFWLFLSFLNATAELDGVASIAASTLSSIHPSNLLMRYFSCSLRYA